MNATLPKRVRVAAAVVWGDGRLLMTQRPPGDPLELRWEFPGGKIESGETPEHALVRELREELGVAARPLEVLDVHAHRYDHGLEVEITFIRCELGSLELTAGHGVHAIRWWSLDELEPSLVLEGDRVFLASLKAGRWPARS